MFIQRLKTTLFFTALISIIISIMYMVMMGVHWLRENYQPSEEASLYLSYILLTLLLILILFILAHIIAGIWLFIAWLFIEPYRAWKQKKDRPLS